MNIILIHINDEHYSYSHAKANIPVKNDLYEVLDFQDIWLTFMHILILKIHTQ